MRQWLLRSLQSHVDEHDQASRFARARQAPQEFVYQPVEGANTTLAFESFRGTRLLQALIFPLVFTEGIST